MTNKTRLLGGCALTLMMLVSPAIVAQDEIDFGDDTSSWALDGECDDPRFEGPGAATIRSQVDLGRDATDCREAYEAGTVTFIGESADDARADTEEPTAMPAPVAQGSGELAIDFGDDSSIFANDGECDDPRFEGPGAATTSSDMHLMRDATDCQQALEAGTVTYIGEADTQEGGIELSIEASPVSPDWDDAIDFGDDSGTWSNDGECDDPRFGGGLESHRFADATDCREAFFAGQVTYLGENGVPDTDTGDSGQTVSDGPIVIDGIDFGDDSGNFARDGECDDARFTGPGMGASFESHIRADATDCSEAYLAGTITLVDEQQEDTGVSDPGFRINYGDDSSWLAFNGVCDDPRFQGRGAALELFDEHLLSDATDCREAMEAGTVTYMP